MIWHWTLRRVIRPTNTPFVEGAFPSAQRNKQVAGKNLLRLTYKIHDKKMLRQRCIRLACLISHGGNQLVIGKRIIARHRAVRTKEIVLKAQVKVNQPKLCRIERFGKCTYAAAKQHGRDQHPAPIEHELPHTLPVRARAKSTWQVTCVSNTVCLQVDSRALAQQRARSVLPMRLAESCRAGLARARVRSRVCQANQRASRRLAGEQPVSLHFALHTTLALFFFPLAACSGCLVAGWRAGSNPHTSFTVTFSLHSPSSTLRELTS